MARNRVSHPVIHAPQAPDFNPHRLAAEDPQEGGLQLRKKPGQLLTREQLKAQKACSSPCINPFLLLHIVGCSFLLTEYGDSCKPGHHAEYSSPS